MKKRNKILLLGACTMLLCGCGKEIPTLSDGSQAVVNFKEIDAISANDLYAKLKETYALDSIITLMDTKILEKEYQNDIESAKKDAESTVKSMKETYGEETINSYYGSMENYTQMLYLNTLQQKAILDYAKTKVTEKEINSYYEKNIYGDITVRHILIKTGVTNETGEEKTKKETEAKNKANEIIKKLNEASNKLEEFERLAKENSDDEATKDKGGSLGAINTGTLSSSYDELLKSARALKDNEYSKEIITTELGYHIIYRESSSEKPSLEDKKEEIKEALANDLLTDDQTLRITAMDELRKKYGMDITDPDIKEKYANYIANQIANARNNANQ